VLRDSWFASLVLATLAELSSVRAIVRCFENLNMADFHQTRYSTIMTLKQCIILNGLRRSYLLSREAWMEQNFRFYSLLILAVGRSKIYGPIFAHDFICAGVTAFASNSTVSIITTHERRIFSVDRICVCRGSAD